MEALFETTAGAPLTIGGIPDVDTGEVRLGVQIPRLLSLLAKHDPDAIIQGLHDFPRDEWPDVLWVHLAFEVMVGCGFVLLAVGLWFFWARRRGARTGGAAAAAGAGGVFAPRVSGAGGGLDGERTWPAPGRSTG